MPATFASHRSRTCASVFAALLICLAGSGGAQGAENPEHTWTLGAGVSVVNYGSELGYIRPIVSRAALERRLGASTWLVLLGEFTYASVEGDPLAIYSGTTLGGAYGGLSGNSAIESTQWYVDGSVGVRQVVGAPGPVTLSVLGLFGAGYSNYEVTRFELDEVERLKTSRSESQGVSVGGSLGVTADLALTDSLALRLGVTAFRLTWREVESRDSRNRTLAASTKRIDARATLDPSLELRLSW